MTLKTAISAWRRRHRQYVVGYIASGNCVYHHERWDKRKAVSLPLTRKEAQRQLARMPSPGAAIFRLVPIEISGGQR